MDVTRLQVKKLNGKYDFDLDLNRRCTIIVGANGVGKTTILRIIECISTYSFYELLKYSFDDIVVDYSVSGVINGTVSINYSDLLPPIDLIVDKAIGIYRSMETITESDCEYITNKTKEYLQNLQEERKLNRIIYEMINQKYEECLFVIYLNNKELTLTRYLALAMEHFIGKQLFPTIFSESRLSNLIHDELQRYSSQEILFVKDYIIERKCTYYLSMVKRIIITDEVNKGSFLKSTFLDWLHSYKGTIPYFKHIDDIKRETEQLPVNWRYFDYYSSVGKCFHGKIDLFNAFITSLKMVEDFEFEKWIDDEGERKRRNYKRDFEINGWYQERKGRHSIGFRSINNKQDVDQIEIESLMNNNTININHLINRFYYDEEFQIGINKKYCDYLADVLDGQIKSVSDDEMKKFVRDKYDDKEFMRYCDNFFNPVISPSVRNWVKKVDVPDDGNKEIGENYEGYKEEYFHIMFATQVKEELEAERNINPKIVRIKNLLEKYFQDKRVMITPCGLRLYDREDKEFTTPIDISEISSGEVKIIVLLFASTFSKSLKIFIDEPELSLSIAWQEDILQDIIDNGECKIVVATHSPYMAGNELLRNSVSYVPG